MEVKEKNLQKEEKKKIDKKEMLVKAMNLTPLKPKGQIKPLFKKILKDPQQLMDQGVLSGMQNLNILTTFSKFLDIDFDYNDKNKRKKIGQKISSSQITAAALNLFVHKVDSTSKKIKLRKDSEEVELIQKRGTKNISKSRDESLSKSSERNKTESDFVKDTALKDRKKSNFLMNIPAPVNILSSIGSDDSAEAKNSKQKMELSSNREMKTNDEGTEVMKSAAGQENSVVLSEMGISLSGEDKDIADVNQKLKKKLATKQTELDKAEFELAKAKSNHIKITRELARFPQEFRYSRKKHPQYKNFSNKESQPKVDCLRGHLFRVKFACEALKTQKRIFTNELTKKQNFLDDIKSKYEQVTSHLRQYESTKKLELEVKHSF